MFCLIPGIIRQLKRKLVLQAMISLGHKWWKAIHEFVLANVQNVKRMHCQNQPITIKTVIIIINIIIFIINTTANNNNIIIIITTGSASGDGRSGRIVL